jgi:uncharacterized protein (TIGR00369 family)
MTPHRLELVRETGIGPPDVAPTAIPLHVWSENAEGTFVELLGIRPLVIEPHLVVLEMDVDLGLLAPHGYLHGGAVTTFADTACGYGTLASLGSQTGFTTVELKANFFGTVRDGTIRCDARPAHMGRTTQVWDASVTVGDRVIAVFRCTQLLLDRD